MQFSKDLQIIIFQHQNKNKLNPLNLKVYTNGNFKHEQSCPRKTEVTEEKRGMPLETAFQGVLSKKD